jgi:hypothetical protein
VPANDQVQKYYNALIASYDILTSAIAQANDRGLKVTKQFVSDVAKGQREALELGKKLAGEPTDFGQYYTAVLEATTAAQGRALTFTQVAYQEALAAGSDARATVEKLVEANKETAQAAVEVARNWATTNPVLDAVRKNWESMAPNGKSAAKKAAKQPEKAAV